MNGLKPLVLVGLSLVLLLAPLAALAQQPADSSAKRPSAGLFSEEASGEQQLAWGWFAFGLYVLAGLIFACASSHLAMHKALPSIPWFFAGLFFNVLGYLVLLTRPHGDASQFPAGIPRGLHKLPRTYTSATCPGCGAPIHPAAVRCPACDADRAPSHDSEAARWRKQQNPH